MDAPLRVTVAHASAAGSTAEVAEEITAVLTGRGYRTTCRPAGPDLDPHDADALVVGSAVHDMAWLPPALEFLGRAAASGRPTWCFSVGGLAEPYGSRRARFLSAGELRRIEQGFPRGFRPRDHHMFAGVVDLARAPLWGRVFYRLTGTGAGDHRDRPAIRAWAATVADGLDDAAPRPGEPAPPGRRAAPDGPRPQPGRSRS
ncbi:flavodoxin [Blastococcus sp. MG754426]|uniref:flavodoxin domain-containing protein n=1 Tax=unclassified Blastococcus TaxID=2619396 RepID=UPI001EF06927|nr:MULTISPECIES: flavodoxin domain-containing protein [unclassified Blastococcus]MCF6507299.1 flavodoxin [Blastococcus sp. MG754426]MCF6510785.1 flavodoxin [Blastococcus sp. MG754427]